VLYAGHLFVISLLLVQLLLLLLLHIQQMFPIAFLPLLHASSPSAIAAIQLLQWWHLSMLHMHLLLLLLLHCCRQLRLELLQL
jgi:hypothetical protein